MAEGLACFTFLRDQAPVWIAELSELEKHVAARQAEIAQLPASFSRPKLKKSGSNESIRPGREDEESDPCLYGDQAVESRGSTESPVSLRYGLTTGGGHADTSSAPARQQDKAPSTDLERMPRKRKTASILSNATAPPKYRSRSMIIVYYDSIVQAAFEQLVRQITSAKNNVRKAKLAARMQLMAALEDEDDDEEDEEYNVENGDPPAIAARRTSVRYRETSPAMFRSARNMAPAVSASMVQPEIGGKATHMTTNTNDRFEQADKLLDEAQSHCESGAHQFLRDGDCDGDTEYAKNSFLEILALSEREIPQLEEEQAKAQRRAERKRNRGSLISEYGSTEMPASRMGGNSAHLGTMSNPIEADDGDDGDEEMELPPIPSARNRGLARSVVT